MFHQNNELLLSARRAMHLGILGVTATALALSPSLAFAADAAGATGSGPAFSCLSDGYLFQGDAIAQHSTVYKLALENGESQEVATLDPVVNATAYNTLDNYMYAFNFDNASVVKIASDWTVTDFGRLQGGPGRAILGEIDDKGHYWLAQGTDNPDPHWYEIDLDPASANYGKLLASGQLVSPPGLLQGPDWALVGGKLLRLMSDASHNLHLVSFDRQTHVQTDLGATNMFRNDIVGAVYSSPDGFLYASANGSGDILRVSPRTLKGIVFAPGHSSRLNDGARCRTAPLRLDLGDAPNSYKTDILSNGPRERTLDGLLLGTVIDGEGDGQASLDALGDDVTNADEDALPAGVTIRDETPNELKLTVTNSTAFQARLAGWIDLNNNGIFEESEMQIVTVPASVGTTSISLSWPSQQLTVGTKTFARFRLQTGGAATLLPYGSGRSGEVEDYQVSILGKTVDGGGVVPVDPTPQPSVTPSDGKVPVTAPSGVVTGNAVKSLANTGFSASPFVPLLGVLLILAGAGVTVFFAVRRRKIHS